MLFAKINKEYVDQDLLANKQVMKRQFQHVSTASKEYIRSKIDDRILYNFDRLFEDFRSAIETIISLDFEDSLTLNKSYEIIKKYNYLSSYLKNIIKFASLSERDEEKIKDKFREILPNLKILYQLAKQYNFVDKGEIEAMVQSVENEHYSGISSNIKGESITSRVNERNELLNMLKLDTETTNDLMELLQNDPYHQQQDPDIHDRVDELKNYYKSEIENIKSVLKSGNDLTQQQREDYKNILKENSQKLQELNQYITQSKPAAIEKFISKNKTIENIYNELIDYEKNLPDDTKIDEIAHEWRTEEEQSELQSLPEISKTYTVQKRDDDILDIKNRFDVEEQTFADGLRKKTSDIKDYLINSSDLNDAVKLYNDINSLDLDTISKVDLEQASNELEIIRDEYKKARKTILDYYKQIKQPIQSVRATPIIQKPIFKTPIKPIVAKVDQNKAIVKHPSTFVNKWLDINTINGVKPTYKQAQKYIKDNDIWDNYKNGTYKLPNTTTDNV